MRRQHECCPHSHSTCAHTHFPCSCHYPPHHSNNRRGAAGGDAAAAAAGDGADADADAEERAKNRAAAAALADDTADMTPAQAAKKARVSAMFDQLHQSSTGSANKLSKSTISLASLCSNTDPKKKRNTDAVGGTTAVKHKWICHKWVVPHQAATTVHTPLQQPSALAKRHSG